MLTIKVANTIINNQVKDVRDKNQFRCCIQALGFIDENDNLLNVISMIVDNFDHFINLLPPNWKKPNTKISGLGSVVKVLKLNDISSIIIKELGEEIYNKAIQILNAKRQELKKLAKADCEHNDVQHEEICDNNDMQAKSLEGDRIVDHVQVDQTSIVEERSVCEEDFNNDNVTCCERCTDSSEISARLIHELTLAKREIAITKLRLNILTEMVTDLAESSQENREKIYVSTIKKLLNMMV